MKEIADFFANVIYKSDKYETQSPCNDTDLLFPPFYAIVMEMINAYQEQHETIPFVLETYRSNTLQRIYFNRGASKIRQNGMHHYGIAVDLVGRANGQIDYEVLDYAWLRDWAKNNGLTVLDWELAHFQFIPVASQNELRQAAADAIS